MLLGAIAIAVLSLYTLTPGDNSGKPYPTKYEDMVREVKELKQFLVDSEGEFQRSEAYAKVVVWNNPLSDESKKALAVYGTWANGRRNTEARIKNLLKLIETYEQINCNYITFHAIDGIGDE